MIIYIDDDFKCHLSNPDGTYTEVETDFFNDKCNTYIEGYRFVPSGASWTRADGTVFTGEMISPWRNWSDLDSAQREYEHEQLVTLSSENEALISDMGALVDEIYQYDMKTIGI